MYHAQGLYAAAVPADAAARGILFARGSIMNRDNTQTPSGLVYWTPKLAISVLVGLTATLLLLFVAALLISGGAMSDTLGTPVTVGLCALGAAAAGFLTARRGKRRVIFAGLAAGALYFGLLALLGAVFFPGVMPREGLWPVLLASVAGGPLGAVLTLAGKR